MQDLRRGRVESITDPIGPRNTNVRRRRSEAGRNVKGVLMQSLNPFPVEKERRKMLTLSFQRLILDLGDKHALVVLKRRKVPSFV